MNLSSYIDHTILKPTTTLSEIEKLCKEAVDHQLAAVCIPPYFVAEAKGFCKDSDCKIATVIDFPFGYSDTKSKKTAIIEAIHNGADELDMVANIAAIKNGNWELLSVELSTVLQVIRLHNKTLKWIIESGDLTDVEVIKCCEIANLHQIDFLKTSTGYGTSGASIHSVQLMRKHLNPDIQIKASGGIKDQATAIAFIENGATRIGTSSALKILGL